VIEDIDEAVIHALQANFGWLSPFALQNKLPLGMQNAAAVADSLDRLQAAKRVELRRRPGNSMLVRIPPAPGQEPTAEVRHDPPARVVKYAGDAQDALPPERKRGQRLVRPMPPERRAFDMAANLSLTAPLVIPPFSPAKAAHPESTMPRRTTAEVHAAVLKALSTAGKPARRAELSQLSGLADSVIERALKQLRTAGRVVAAGAGRAVTWAMANGKGAAPSATPAPKPTLRVDAVSTLQWSIRNDGVAIFIAGGVQLEVDGTTLERVARARQAILEAA
jgi:hypothetical protein